MGVSDIGDEVEVGPRTVTLTEVGVAVRAGTGVRVNVGVGIGVIVGVDTAVAVACGHRSCGCFRCRKRRYGGRSSSRIVVSASCPLSGCRRRDRRRHTKQ